MRDLGYKLLWAHRPPAWSLILVGLITTTGITVHGLKPMKVQAEATQEIIVVQNATDGLPPVPPSVDCSVEACIAITFDDGPDREHTPKMLDILGRHQVKATFFVLGSRVAGNEDILRRMQNSGHEIGNHSWNHPNFTKLTPEQIKHQVDLTQMNLEAAGVHNARFFRPPYGARNDQVRETVKMPMALWNVDPHDWKERNPDAMLATVHAQVKPGSIILFHDIYDTSIASAERAITELKAHYKLVTVTELMQLPHDAEGEYFGRPQ